jgi:hypothetical protein
MSRFVPLRTTPPLVSRFAEPLGDLAAALDETEAGPAELVLLRPRHGATEVGHRAATSVDRSLALEPAPAPAAGPIATPNAQPGPKQPLSDAEWAARMKRYLVEKKQREAEAAAKVAAAQAAARADGDEPSGGMATAPPGQPAMPTWSLPSATPGTAESGLSLATFVRGDTAPDGSPLSEWDQARLDRVATRALALSDKMLGPLLRVAGPRLLGTIQVELSLDLATVTDEEAAERWVQELGRTIRGRLRRGAVDLSPRRSSEEEEG